MTVVLKLGGSVITRKDRREQVDGAALAAAADAIADAPDRLALVHGAGSFGHYYAEKHGTTVDRGTHDAVAVAEIHGSMKALNRHVLSRLHEREVPALPVHPLSVGARDADGALSLPLDSTRTMLEEGFLPVLHGDGVVQTGEGVTILSGDEVVVRLAEGLDADRVGLCSSVPGVLDADGEVLPRIESFEDAADALGESEDTDVTGGMAGKVRTLLDLDAPAWIFGPSDLRAFLRGESPGTRVD